MPPMPLHHQAEEPRQTTLHHETRRIPVLIYLYFNNHWC
jgi:hypothetical protein